MAPSSTPISEAKPIPEILSPAGDMTCLQAALDAGADAVYLGLESFNMRVGATRNFTRETLPEASARCRARGVKLYLTLNSLVYENELAAVRDEIAFAKPFADAAIVADWAVAQACVAESVPFHVSTQMSCSNSAAAKFLVAQGAARIVLARECSLDEIGAIAKEIAPAQIEVFVHGAMCVAVSGRCLLSHDAYGFSASRGECRQPCRRRFRIRELDEGDGAVAEFTVEPHAVLSARDLCSLPFLDKLAAAGAGSFKIEGRARNPEYVATVTRAYKRAVLAIADGSWSAALAESLVAECAKTYHREFGCGLYHGRPGAKQMTSDDENHATEKKSHSGIVMNYYKRTKAAQVMIQDKELRVGDRISIQGPATGVAELTVESLRRDDETPAIAERGKWVTIPCRPTVRKNDKVFLVVKAS